MTPVEAEREANGLLSNGSGAAHPLRKRGLSHALRSRRRRAIATDRALVRWLTGSLRVCLSAIAGGEIRRPRDWKELRVSPPRTGKGEVAWSVFACARSMRIATTTLWTISEETGEHDRHETFFQDLQYAIDYLDHAPAGFFSAEPDGSIAHMNATLAGWLHYDLGQFSLGRLKIHDIIADDGVIRLTTMTGGAGEVVTQQFDVALKPRGGGAIPVRILHKVAFSNTGAPGPSALLSSTARRKSAATKRILRVGGTWAVVGCRESALRRNL